MTTVSFSDFRNNMAHFLNMTEDDADPIIINRGKGRKAVILSLDEFLSLQETAHLLFPQKNRKHLEQSLQDLQTGKTVSVDIAA